MSSLGNTAISTLIGTVAGVFFDAYFPYLPALQRHYLASFIIGAGMAIGIERHGVLLRAFISGLLFTLFTTPEDAYVLLWGPPLLLPVITIVSMKGQGDAYYKKVSFKRYFGLSCLAVLILICSIILTTNLKILLEGHHIIKPVY